MKRSSPGRVERCIEDFVEAAVRFLYSRVAFKLAAFVGLREHSVHAVRLFQSLWSHAEAVLVLRIHACTRIREYASIFIENYETRRDYYAAHTHTPACDSPALLFNRNASFSPFPFLFFHLLSLLTQFPPLLDTHPRESVHRSRNDSTIVIVKGEREKYVSRRRRRS